MCLLAGISIQVFVMCKFVYYLKNFIRIHNIKNLHDKCTSLIMKVNGSWTSWSSWTACPTCGYASTTRQRTCSKPLYGGFNCSGNWSETSICTIPPCPGKVSLHLMCI